MLKLHDKHPKPVKNLQRNLKVTADGIFGRQTEAALMNYQKSKNLNPTGILTTEFPYIYNSYDLTPLANKINIYPEFLATILRIESNSNPTAIRFEPHIFNRQSTIKMPFTNTNNIGFSTIPSETNKEAFDKAFLINKELAVKSTSWGLTQVMGSHLLKLHKDPETAVKAFYDSPQATSYELTAKWFEDNPKAVTQANNLDFDGFARSYNGPLYKNNNYHNKLKSNYLKLIG